MREDCLYCPPEGTVIVSPADAQDLRLKGWPVFACPFCGREYAPEQFFEPEG